MKRKVLIIIISSVLVGTISFFLLRHVFRPKKYIAVEKVLETANKNRIDARVLDMENLGAFTASDSAQILWKTFQNNPGQFHDKLSEQFKYYSASPSRILGELYRVNARIDNEPIFFYTVMRDGRVISILSDLP